MSQKRSSWGAVRILALLGVVLVAVSGSLGGLYYYALRPSSRVSTLQCSNGGTNYPSCNSCSSGQTLVGESCVNNCANGATNPPNCNRYPPCANGATNPPACIVFPSCTNGATNYPQCTTSSCSDPGSISSHVYNLSRLQVVKPCATATGLVERVIEEADGDVHLRLKLDPPYGNLTNAANDLYQYGDLVVEIICVGTVSQADALVACQGYTNNIPVPNFGEEIIVTGPYVLDTEHYNWAEIHPVYSLTVTGPVLGATVGIEENLEIQYANGATYGWLGPSSRTIVTAVIVQNGNQYLETLTLYSTSNLTEHIGSIGISTQGYSVVNISPSPPVTFAPVATLDIVVTIQAPDAYFHGPLDVQIAAS